MSRVCCSLVRISQRGKCPGYRLKTSSTQNFKCASSSRRLSMHCRSISYSWLQMHKSNSTIQTWSTHYVHVHVRTSYMYMYTVHVYMLYMHNLQLCCIHMYMYMLKAGHVDHLLFMLLFTCSYYFTRK